MNDIDTLRKRAEILCQQKRFAQALELLSEAQALDPENALLYYQQGFCHYALEHIVEAEQFADLYISKEPDDPDAYGLKARIELLNSKPIRATDTIKRGLECDPDNVALHLLLSQAMDARGYNQEALNAADDGLQLDPDNVNLLNMRGQALSALHQFEEAQETIQYSLSLDPENTFTHCCNGWNNLRQGNQQLARRAYQTALRIDPNNQFARDGLIESLKIKNFVYRMFYKVYSSLFEIGGGKLWLALFASTLMKFWITQFADPVSLIRLLSIPASLVMYSTLCIVIARRFGPAFFNCLLVVHPVGKHALSKAAHLQAWFLNIIFILILSICLHLYIIQFYGMIIDTAIIGTLLFTMFAFASETIPINIRSRILCVCLSLLFTCFAALGFIGRYTYFKDYVNYRSEIGSVDLPAVPKVNSDAFNELSDAHQLAVINYHKTTAAHHYIYKWYPNYSNSAFWSCLYFIIFSGILMRVEK